MKVSFSKTFSGISTLKHHKLISTVPIKIISWAKINIFGKCILKFPYTLFYISDKCIIICNLHEIWFICNTYCIYVE